MAYTCSTCGGAAKVVRTVPSARYITRHRKCPKCGATSSTVELDKADLERVVATSSSAQSPNPVTIEPYDPAAAMADEENNHSVTSG